MELLQILPTRHSLPGEGHPANLLSGAGALGCSVATDSRGSVLAEPTGEARVASPYGQRDVHPAMAAALDYVEKGYDADLGLVRMGARDYDPETGRFTTPDPLFFESLKKCAGSAVECNLFGYAGGNPIAFVDPTGLGIFDISADTKTRAFGAFRVIGGTAELALAGAATGASGGTAAAFSFLLGVHGMDQIQAGLQQLIDGKDTDTMLSQSLQAAGMSRTAANLTDAGVGVALTVGVSVTGLVAQTGPVLLEMPAPAAEAGPKLLDTARGNLLAGAKDASLRNLIGQMYRKTAQVGSGSTADAIRHELATGELLSPKGHFVKGQEMRTALSRLLGSNSLSEADRQIAQHVLGDLQRALSGQ